MIREWFVERRSDNGFAKAFSTRDYNWAVHRLIICELWFYSCLGVILFLLEEGASFIWNVTMGLFTLLHFLLYAFVDHLFSNLRILSHLANKSSCDVIIVVYKVSLIKGYFRFGHNCPLVSWSNRHINTHSQGVSVYIVGSQFFCFGNCVYLYSGVLFRAISESLLHVIPDWIGVLVFVALPTMEEVGRRVISTISLIEMHRRTTVFIGIIP